MEHISSALLGPAKWAKTIGKETSNTSFGVGALKKDDKIVTTLYPTKYPEKIWSLLFPLYLSDEVFLNVKNIDKELGETIIALDLLEKKKGKLHVGDLVDRSMFVSIINGTVVEKYDEIDLEPGVLREKLLVSEPSSNEEGATIVEVDQSFHVKGVGCVVLGFVTSGIVSKHQELTTCPGSKRTIVRSIQIHDKDHDTAPAGARVGLAMKNISPDDLPRGTALSSEGSGISETERIKVDLNISPHWKGDFKKGDRFHLYCALQFAPCTLEEVNERSVAGKRILEAEISIEGKIWAGPNSRYGLAYLDSKTFRLIAAGESI